MKKLWFVVFAVIFCLPIMTSAQESTVAAPPQGLAQITPEADLNAIDAPLPGVVEGKGTHFELSGSGYIDVVFDSSVPVELRMTSAPELITMHLEASPDPGPALITLGGFKPSTTYYKYEDEYHNKEVFTTDGAGSFSFMQDLSTAHFVYIQPRKSTKFISDNATGGDCAAIGLWDAAAKTCTLAMDLNETVQIDGNNITFDGNGHTIAGTGTGFGVYVPGRTGVTVKGVIVKNFGDGIYLRSSASCTVSGNTAMANTGGPYWGGGIHLDYSTNSIVVDNRSSSNANSGISLSYSSGILVTGNTATGNAVGFSTGYTWTSTFSENLAESNGAGFGVGGSNKPWEELNNLFVNNVSRKNSIGMMLSANYSTLLANTVSENDIGINFNDPSYNTLTDNIVRENRTHDIMFRWFWLSGSYGMMVGSSDCTNTIENTTGSGGRPIKYFTSAVDLRNETLAELILCNANGSTITDVTIAGSDTLNNNALLLLRTDGATLRNVVSSDNRTGIYLNESSSNIIENSVTDRNEDGIRLSWSSSNNTVRNNSASGNSRAGIYVHHGSNDGILMTGNAVAGSPYGIVLEMTGNSSLDGNTVTNTTSAVVFYAVQNSTFTNNSVSVAGSAFTLSGWSAGNSIYNNSFSDYATPAVLTGSLSGNVFNLDRPVGGNYWSKFDSPAEGCSDLDRDGFCDAPYNLVGAFDNLPWAAPDGWKLPADTTAPTTTSMTSGTAGDNGWYRSDVLVTLLASDNDGGSGVKEIHYTLDGVETTVPGSSASFTVAAEGVHGSAYYANDNAGNAESAHPLTVQIDKTAPVVTATALPAPNASGWNNTDVTITFTCTDALSGVASCPAPALLSTEGAGQPVTDSAADKAGNTASAGITLNLDRTAPVTTAALNGMPVRSCFNTDVIVTLSATDVLSGVAATEYRVNGGGWQAYAGGFTLSAEGAYVISYRSIDLAGNSELEKTVSFAIDKTAPEAIIKFDPSARDIKVYDSETGVETGYTVLPSGHDDDAIGDDDHEEDHRLDRECEGHDGDGCTHRALRQYSLTDCAGNSLLLLLAYRTEEHEVKASVISMQYNNGSVIEATKNKIQAEYSLTKNGAIKELEQKIKIRMKSEVAAHYSAEKNVTDIVTVVPEQGVRHEIREGMSILELVSYAGSLSGRH